MINLYYTGSYLLVLLTAFLLSYLFTPLSKISYIRKSIRSFPVVTLWLSFFVPIALIIFLIKPGFFASTEFIAVTHLGLLGILCGVTLILLLGLIEESIKLPTWIIFLGQILSSIFLIISDIRINIQFIPLGPINILITILWVVLIIEAFRRLSSINGLSEGIALIATIPLFLIGKLNGDPLVYITSFALIGIVLGFFRYSIFYDRFTLGRSGSMFLGFIIAALSMANNYSQSNPVAFLVPFLILAIPLHDVSIRILSKIKILAKRKPFFSLLVKLDFTQTESLLICYFLTFILGLISTVIFKVPLGWALAIFGYTIIGIIFLYNRIHQTQTMDIYIKKIKKLFFNWVSSWQISTDFSYKESLRIDIKMLSWLIIDIILINIGIYSAYLARFNGVIDPNAFRPYINLWPYITVAHLMIFTFFKLYKHPNKSPKLEIFLNTIKAISISTLISISIAYFFREKNSAFPSSVFLISWLFNIILISGWRVFIRYDVGKG